MLIAYIKTADSKFLKSDDIINNSNASQRK